MRAIKRKDKRFWLFTKSDMQAFDDVTVMLEQLAPRMPKAKTAQECLASIASLIEAEPAQELEWNKPAE